jgi:hypothetical protein
LVRIKRKLSGLVAVATLIVSSLTVTAQQSVADSSALQHMLDSMGISKSDLEAKVQSTLMFGGSAPVSFSGEARLRLQYHQIDNAPEYLEKDKTYLQSNWEGNESFIRLGMVVRAGRNAVLWTKIGFQNTLPGNYVNPEYVDQLEFGEKEIASETHKDGSPAIIHEDMNAGIAIRTVPVSFMLKMGAVQWIESSPLTVWKSQPRTFAWEYLPFEVEQPIARYFEYNLAKGEKSGRAAWNKKAFQGITLESINLPGNLYFNFLYGTVERYDNFEREFVDFSNDIAYAGETSPAKGIGIGDSYRHVIFSKIAANELFGRFTPSLDFTAITYDKDVYKIELFKKVFMFYDSGATAFYKQPLTASFDLRGPATDKFTIHGNIALNYVDTVLLTKTITTNAPGSQKTMDTVVNEKHKGTPINPAGYLRFESTYFLPVNADIAYIGKGFYSPKSFAAPVDAFFPFGANLLGPGKFIGGGDASPYTQNMAGINLQVIPKLPGYGHLKFSYGQHFQLKSAQDVIFFPYRLNGQDLFSLFHSSYTRWGNGLIDHHLMEVGNSPNNPTNSKYKYRMGDEGYVTNTKSRQRGPMAGGLRTDFLSAYEGFVPYQDSAMAQSNYDSVPKYTSGNNAGNYTPYTKNSVKSIYTPGRFVPKHQKFTFNLDMDGSYDIGPLVGYPRDLFMGLYAAINGVSTSFKAIALNDKTKDMLLWGTYVRFEPAIAITNKFYILGVAGFENWRAQNTYMPIYCTSANDFDTSDIEKNLGTEAKNQYNKGKRLFLVPIDYRDYALGVGFDWDVLARVGLHGRVKWMKHDDVNFQALSWETPIISAEIKMWF